MTLLHKKRYQAKIKLTSQRVSQLYSILNLNLGAIITWTKQIKNVLKKDPESALKNGNHPDPLTEIEFWKNKSDDLNAICDQLNSERIKKVLKFLE